MSTLTSATALQAGKKPFVLKEGLIVALWSIAVMLVVMNTTMFNLALTQVATDFTLTPTSVSWIVTGYSIVFAISSITYSRLSDFISIRNLLTIGLLSLATASLIGFFSHNFILLMIARLLQASGAAAAPGLGIVLITRYIPAERRGKSMATIVSAASLGFGLGPVIGGSITQYLGWNYLFAVTGIVLFMIPLFFRFLPTEPAKKVVFDFLGACLIGIGITGLLLFLTNHSVIALLAGVLSLILFAFRIRHSSNPFVQPALFRNLPYMTLSVMGFASYVANFATLFLMPMMMVRLFGLTASQTGLIIFPGAILSMVASRRIGKIIDQYGNLTLIRYAHLVLLVATVLLALFSKTSYYSISSIYIMMSISVSALTSSVSNEMSRILPKEHIGAGMGLSQLTQFFGGAFGVAMTGSALIWMKNLSLESAFSNIFWGMTALVVISTLCSWLYRSSKS
jgi:DHA2 family metal-tetracycline-proton antiporter-like MFS transporter